jgi:arylsulfatase A-like enzyme
VLGGLLIIGLLPVGCSRAPTQTGEPKAQPERRAANILFILTDDQAPHTVGFEGNQVIRTPNLDRMASEGMVFSRAYVPIPQCAPSRAALLTGLYPHVHGPMHNDDPKLAPGVATIADVLGERGYRRGLVGKWHLDRPLEKQAGFDDFWVAYDKSATPRDDKYTHPTIVVNGKSSRVERYLTDVFTDYAIEFIDQPDERPFFLWLAYHAPHTPITAHPDYRYRPADMPLPANMVDDLSTKPTDQRRGGAHHLFQSGYQDRKRLQADLADYYSMISAIDANVGRLLAHLRETGLDENTLVVYFSDNGWMIGEHQMVSKGGAFYEELVRMPLVFWQPGTVPAGRKTDALVSSVDFFPTFCARAGADVPSDRSGRDIWPLVTGAAGGIRDSVFLEYQQKSAAEFTPMIGVVTAQYKYARYLATAEEELYDLRADPTELTNLAGAPDHSQTLASMRERSDEFRRTIRKPFWVK